MSLCSIFLQMFMWSSVSLLFLAAVFGVTCTTTLIYYFRICKWHGAYAICLWSLHFMLSRSLSLCSARSLVCVFFFPGTNCIFFYCGFSFTLQYICYLFVSWFSRDITRIILPHHCFHEFPVDVAWLLCWKLHTRDLEEGVILYYDGFGMFTVNIYDHVWTS